MSNLNNNDLSNYSSDKQKSPYVQNEKVKLLMVGDSAAGKSSLLQRFVDKDFSNSFITTIGIDFKVKYMNYGNTKKKVLIWDTAGQERFRTISRSYFRGSQGILLVFDVTNRKSFDNISNWVFDIKNTTDNDPVIILVGNKCDLEDNRLISREEAEKKASDNNFPYFETSAKTGQNVDLVYQTVFDLVCKKTSPKEPFKTTIELEPINDTKNCCK
jgi:small GTP-binding protein